MGRRFSWFRRALIVLTATMLTWTFGALYLQAYLPSLVCGSDGDCAGLGILVGLSWMLIGFPLAVLWLAVFALALVRRLNHSNPRHTRDRM
jgi:hypothetical protein